MIYSAGIIPVDFRSDSAQADAGKGAKPLFLLLRVYQYWDFPKGEVEAGEEPQLAALRECAEETGIVKPEFRWGDDYFETKPYARKKIARYYVAQVRDNQVKLVKNPLTGVVEHHEYRWCTYSAARKLLGERVKEALDWAQQLIGDY